MTLIINNCIMTDKENNISFIEIDLLNELSQLVEQS